MKEKGKRFLGIGSILVVGFVIWTVLIQRVDVQTLGVNGTDIGFATINCWFHQLTGVHMEIYTITDWLGLVPIFICMIFDGIGCVQLMKERSLFKVDYDIILLGIYYILVVFGYLIFEMIPINYRPILIEGFMEASYPSLTTLLTPHVCRHTYCSNMAKSGMNPKTLQYLMGHSDISVTMNVYMHIGSDDAEEELKRMEEFRKAQAKVEQKKEKPMSQKMFKVV